MVDCLRCDVPLSPTGQADPLRFHQCPRAHPTQPVGEIVGPMRAGEDDLREFLRLLADDLERRATPR